jgi:hypothetical protein
VAFVEEAISDFVKRINRDIADAHAATQTKPFAHIDPFRVY